MHASSFKCDEELTSSSEIELPAKWCILKSRIEGYEAQIFPSICIP
jgi:hypothetical protein